MPNFYDPFGGMDDEDYGQPVRFVQLPDGRVAPYPAPSQLPIRDQAFPFPFPGPPKSGRQKRPWEPALPAEGVTAVPPAFVPPAVAESSPRRLNSQAFAGEVARLENELASKNAAQEVLPPKPNPPASNLVKALTGGRNPNGYTYGFGGGLSEGAKAQIAKSQANDVRRWMTPSQRRQVDTPIRKSGLEEALESLGTREEKMLRGLRDYTPVTGSDVATSGGIKPDTRTRGFVKPSGRVQLVGGTTPLPKEGVLSGKESDQVARRMANVDERIARKNAMDEKLIANRAIKKAEKKAQEGGSLGEPKNAAEAGFNAVVAAVKQNKFLDKDSRLAIFQAASQSFTELEKQKIQNQGFGNTGFGEIMKGVIPGIMSNPDGSFASPEDMQQRLQQVAPLIGAIKGMLTGGVGFNLPPATASTKATVPKEAIAMIDGMSPDQARKTLIREGYSAQIANEGAKMREEGLTPRQKKESEKTVAKSKKLEGDRKRLNEMRSVYNIPGAF